MSKTEDIATAEEVLSYLTRMIRGENTTAGMKAAELLGKRMGLFSEREETKEAVIIVDDVRAVDAP